MRPLIEQLLKEPFIDQDIKDLMLAESDFVHSVNNHPVKHRNWELLQDPFMAILKWQEARDSHVVTNVEVKMDPCAYPFKSGQKCVNMVCPWCHPTNCCRECSYMVIPQKDHRCININCPCGHKPKTYSDAVCRGSWVLGTACGKCQRCLDTKPI
jgi:hypothetical protein